MKHDIIAHIFSNNKKVEYILKAIEVNIGDAKEITKNVADKKSLIFLIY